MLTRLVPFVAIVAVGCTPLLDIDGFAYDGVGGSVADGGSDPATGGGAAAGGASAGGSGGMGGGGASGWLDPDFARRRPLTIDNPTGEAQSDVPLLVALDANRIDYAAMQASGEDLRFYSDAGVALAHEIELWDAAGVSHVWVLVPELAASTTTIWMYGASPAASDAQQPAAVWVNDFVSVWHLGTGLEDATGTADATNSGSTDAAGVVGRGRGFALANSYLDVGAVPASDGIFTTGGTLEAWIHPVDWAGGFSRIIDKATGGTGENGFVFHTRTGSVALRRDFSTTDGIWETAANSVSLDTWQHITLVYNDVDADPKFYIDGVASPATETTAPSGTPGDDTGVALRIANNVTTAARAFEGTMDEVRISSVARSASWVAIQHASMTDDLIEFGAEEAR